MTQNTRFSHYQQLLGRVDDKFTEISSRHANAFTCKKGCFGCCKSGLTITNIEAQHIRQWLADRPLIKEKIEGLEVSQPHGEDYCGMLDEDGACTIYEVRPVVCRSHGAPILIPDEDEQGTLDADVCPLNFQEIDLATLASSDWIRLDTLNTILATVDRDYDPKRAGERSSLSPRGSCLTCVGIDEITLQERFQ